MANRRELGFSASLHVSGEKMVTAACLEFCIERLNVFR
jgi:hypothetical protein